MCEFWLNYKCTISKRLEPSFCVYLNERKLGIITSLNRKLCTIDLKNCRNQQKYRLLFAILSREWLDRGAAAESVTMCCKRWVRLYQELEQIRLFEIVRSKESIDASCNSMIPLSGFISTDIIFTEDKRRSKEVRAVIRLKR